MRAIGTSEAEWAEAGNLIALWERMGKEKIERKVAEMVPSGASVVDLGCGNGRYAKYFEDYRGYDQSAAMIANAPSSCQRANILDGAPYEDLPDYLLSIDTSRHYADPIDMLRMVIDLWPAEHYLFSILCGPQTEERSNIMVLSAADAAAGIATLGEIEAEMVEDLGEGLYVRYVVLRPEGASLPE